MWQTWVVIIVLVMSAGYAVWHVYRTLTFKGDSCEGCPLKDSCKKYRSMNGGMNDGMNVGHDCCKNGGHACSNC